MILNDLFPYDDYLNRLRAAGVPHPADELHMIIGVTLGRDIVVRPTFMDISTADQEHIATAVAAREQRIPIERIFQTIVYADIDLSVRPDVYKPYAETEDALLHTLSLFPDRDAPARILDLGTGSGFILLALLKALPQASGIGVDISPTAIESATHNAVRNLLNDRATFQVNDWSSGIVETFDLVIANPPRVATSDIPHLLPEMRYHDPHLALDGGADGLDFFRRLADDFRRLVKPGGFGCVQTGLRYAEAALRLFEQSGLKNMSLKTNPLKQPSLIVYHNIPSRGWRQTITRFFLR